MNTYPFFAGLCGCLLLLRWNVEKLGDLCDNIVTIDQDAKICCQTRCWFSKSVDFESFFTLITSID